MLIDKGGNKDAAVPRLSKTVSQLENDPLRSAAVDGVYIKHQCIFIYFHFHLSFSFYIKITQFAYSSPARRR